MNSRDLEKTDIVEIAQTVNEKLKIYTEQMEYSIGECQDAAEIITQLKNIMSMMRGQSVNEEEAKVIITCKCRTKIIDQRFLLIKQ
jgi:peptide subunit release factor RF-3